MTPPHSAPSAAHLLTREISTGTQIRTSLFLAALLVPFSSWLLYMKLGSVPDWPRHSARLGNIFAFLIRSRCHFRLRK